MATITIVGGGVAGLTLAATLDPARHAVTIVERHPIGATVPTLFGIWPFALRALGRIGLDDELRARGLLLTSGIFTADSADRPVSVTKREANAWVISRVALLALLDQAVPSTVVRQQQRVEDPTALDGDLVVAADGARSVVRGRVWGDAPRDTGIVALRGVTSTPPDFPHDQMREYWGCSMLFGIGPDPLPSGLGTNWYAAARRSAQAPADALAWARTAFRDFPQPVGQTLAAATPELTLVNPILESRFTRTLVKGRYVLVGDAAHAMSPNLGRGACEAMVDAIALGQALNEQGLGGVRHYAKARLRPGQITRIAAAAVRRASMSPMLGRALVKVATLRA